MYEYMWVLTMAQVSLLALDQPIVVYDHKKDKKKKGEFKKADPLAVLRAAQKYEQNQSSQPKSFDLSSFTRKTSDEGESKQ